MLVLTNVPKQLAGYNLTNLCSKPFERSQTLEAVSNQKHDNGKQTN